MTKSKVQFKSKIRMVDNYVPLPRSFYARDTHEVARDLLGKLLVRRWRGRELTGRIVEVESYVGEDDAACHASRGRTERTDVLYGDAGHAYVYFIYGMYDMLNVVTEHKEFPAAVLIRGVVPVLGIDGLTDGPGKLTRALHITRAQNREDVTRSDALFVADDSFAVANQDIARTPRIGVDYAGADANLPWRYVLENPKLEIQKSE